MDLAGSQSVTLQFHLLETQSHRNIRPRSMEKTNALLVWEEDNFQSQLDGIARNKLNGIARNKLDGIARGKTKSRKAPRLVS